MFYPEQMKQGSVSKLFPHLRHFQVLLMLCYSEFNVQGKMKHQKTPINKM